MVMLNREIQDRTNERLAENTYALDRVAELICDMEQKT